MIRAEGLSINWYNFLHENFWIVLHWKKKQVSKSMVLEQCYNIVILVVSGLSLEEHILKASLVCTKNLFHATMGKKVNLCLKTNQTAKYIHSFIHSFINSYIHIYIHTSCSKFGQNFMSRQNYMLKSVEI